MKKNYGKKPFLTGAKVSKTDQERRDRGKRMADIRESARSRGFEVRESGQEKEQEG
jgi:hypothetical protein